MQNLSLYGYGALFNLFAILAQNIYLEGNVCSLWMFQRLLSVESYKEMGTKRPDQFSFTGLIFVHFFVVQVVWALTSSRDTRMLQCSLSVTMLLRVYCPRSSSSMQVKLYLIFEIIDIWDQLLGRCLRLWYLRLSISQTLYFLQTPSWRNTRPQWPPYSQAWHPMLCLGMHSPSTFCWASQ